jgi:hypothetical protein
VLVGGLPRLLVLSLVAVGGCTALTEKHRYKGPHVSPLVRDPGEWKQWRNY